MTDAPLTLFDSHAHLDGERFAKDRDEAIQRAVEAGIKQMVFVNCATTIEELESSINVAVASQQYATVGVHPHDAKVIDDSWWEPMERAAKHERVVAIGETGLDYHYDYSPRDVQRKRFADQIALAKKMRLPVVCHVRDAHEEAREILVEGGAGKDLDAVIHCFTGTPEDAAAYAKLGLYVSFSGIITFRGKSANPIREAAPLVPKDRILIETDAPFLAPEPHRGKRNEPSFLPATARKVAELLDMSPEAFAKLTVDNTRRFFGVSA